MKWKLILLILFVLMSMSIFFYWMRHSSLNIRKIDVVENSLSKTSSLEANVSNSLNGNIFFFIPKTNALFFPRFEVQENLKKSFPEIAAIDIDLKGLHEIEVEIEEYEPKIILETKNGTFFVNEFGDIFMKTPLLHSYDDLFVFSTEEDDLDIRSNFVDPEFLKSMISFLTNLESINIKVFGLDYRNEDVYYVMTDLGFEILVASTDNLEESFKNIKSIIENGALSEEDLNSVEYIDLRFGNKVFYKFKG